jgi:hypothetical protein
MAFNYSPKTVTDGLVFCLDAANNKSYVSGSTKWNDLSRGGSNGTLINSPTYNSSNGGSIVFDGVDDYVESTNLTNLGYNTWSGWIYPTSFTDHAYHTVVAKAYASAWWFGLNNNDGRVQLWAGGAAVASTGAVLLNTWSHITAAWDGTNVYFYINGVLDSTISRVGTPVSNSATVKIGADFNLGTTGSLNYHFTGRIAQVSIYNRVLTATEIQQTFNTLKTRFGL